MKKLRSFKLLWLFLLILNLALISCSAQDAEALSESTEGKFSLSITNNSSRTITQFHFSPNGATVSGAYNNSQLSIGTGQTLTLLINQDLIPVVCESLRFTFFDNSEEESKVIMWYFWEENFYTPGDVITVIIGASAATSFLSTGIHQNKTPFMYGFN